MEGISKEYIKSALVFAAMAAITFGIFYGAYHGTWDKDFQRQVRETKWAWETIKPLATANDKVTLTLQKPVVVGKNKLVFQGLEHNQIHIAVYILAIDPQSAYHHTISIREAKKGFRLGEVHFKLVDYDKNEIRLHTAK
jgi:hypothetical protein